MTEAGQVGDIYAIVFRKLFGIFSPGSGAIATTMYYNQWVTLPTGKVTDVKVLNFGPFAVYIVSYVSVPYLRMMRLF